MNSFIRGLGGGIGRVFGRVIAIIIVGVIGYFIVNSLHIDVWDFISSRILMNAKAQTQTINQTIYNPTFGPCGASGSGKYCAYTSPNTYNIRDVGTTYNGVLNGITFSFQQNLSNADLYTFTITAMGTDFRNNNFDVDYYGSNNSTSIGTTLGFQYRFVSKSVIQVTLPRTTYMYHTIILSGEPLTGVSNYGIKSVVMTYDDGTQDNSDIINNATNNTTDIINNANQNIEDILQSINGMFGNKCLNMWNINSYDSNSFSSISVTEDSVTLTASSNWKILHYTIPIQNGLNYNIHFGSQSTGAVGYYSFDNSNWNSIPNYRYTHFTAESNNLYIRIQNSVVGTGTYVFKDMILSKGTNEIAYCVSGSTTSKIDEQTWWMQQIKESADSTSDTLKDDNLDNGLGSSFFSDFQDNDFGLSSIVTLPITTIQLLTSQSCVALEIPVPFTNNGRIILPCMSEVYQSKVPQLYTLWQVVCYGLIGYWIGTDIFRLVKGFKNPDEDKVEVMDL